MMKSKLTNQKFQRIFLLLFIFYLLVLVKIILLKDASIASLPERLNQDYEGFRSLNLIPFQTFWTFFQMIPGGNFLWSFSNIAGNMFVFLPYGYLLSLLKIKKHPVFKILISSICLSLFFEISQFVFYLGSTDVDDIILNTLGTALGILCFHIISSFCQNNQRNIYRISLILGIVAFTGALAIGYFEFGTRLGIAKYSETTIGGENIPKHEPDFYGYFSSGNISNVTVSNSLDQTFAEQTKVKITPNTDIYYLTFKTNKWNPHKTYKTYKLYSRSQLKSLKKNSLVSIWYSKKEKEKTADVIVISQPIDTDHGDITIEEKNTGATQTLDGCIQKLSENKFTVNKVDHYKTEDGQVSTSTKVYLPVHYTEDVQIRVRDIYGNGTKYEDHHGSIKDLKKDRFVSMQGIYKNKIFYAKNILVEIFH